MLTVYPPYYKQFNCIAAKCPDTCCAKWEVVVDEKFKTLCKKSNTPAAKKALKKMYTDSDGDLCLRLTNGRCPMLNEHNLCQVYIDMGKDALCNTCKTFPRFFKESNEYVIAGISLSCPEAARIILNDYSDKSVDIAFLPKTDDIIFFEMYNSLINMVADGKFFDCDFEKLEYVSDELIFNRSNFTADMISECFYRLNTDCTLGFASDKIPDMPQFEYLTDKLPKLLDKLKTYTSNNEYSEKYTIAFLNTLNSKHVKNLVIYYLYKYLWEAIDEHNIELWIKRAYALAILTCKLYCIENENSDNLNLPSYLDLSKLISKEIEHNSNNLDKFEDFCSTNLQ